MDDETFVQFGRRDVWGGSQPFGLSARDRRQHVYLIGKSGAGKSTLLRNLVLQDIEADRGVAVIDPHGDLCDEILAHFPPRRADHLVYFNPIDLDYPIALNLLAKVPADPRPRIASGVVSAFKTIWRDSWGPRLEYILFQAAAALLECDNVSLLGAQRMLVHDDYRRWVTKQIRDPMLRSFWTDEFEQWDDRFRTEAIAPLQNKLGALLVAPLRNVLGQVRSKFDARFIMDHSRVFIANLSRGRLGEDKANLLGAILVTQFQLAAMSRSDLTPDQRRPFTLVCDEFPGYATDSMASILSESRKWALSIVLANQFIDQMQPSVRSAVFGNVGTIVSYRVGESDAAILAREFGNIYPASAFSGLANFEVIMRRLNSEPFAGAIDPPGGTPYGRRDALVQRCRERYGVARATVEGKIGRWMSD